MSFRPSLHGWPFPNEFDTEGVAGLASPPFPELGLGGGMCWAALDRYLAGVRIRRDRGVPEPGDALHAELVTRQVAALASVKHRIREWQERPAGSWRDRVPLPAPLLPVGGDLTSRTRGEWRGIRRRVSASEPVLLTLLAESDGYTRSRAAWQVLAYGYTREGGRVTLSLYDPARPDDDDFRLAFSLRGPLDAKLTGGRAIRGFFAVPYDRSRPSSLRAETFADRAVIGLNRKVEGRPAPAVSRRALDLVARDTDGKLLHFRRVRGKHWQGTNVTAQEGLGTSELYSDPVAVSSTGALHVFARTYVGDLLHFTQRRGWSVSNRTEHKRAGPRFRLEGEPVAVAAAAGAVSVVGRGKDGVLVHYTGSPVNAWIAEEVSPAGNHPLYGDPLAVRLGKAVHVVGRSRDGHVLHFERMRNGWSSADATKEAFPEREVRVLGRPAVIVHDGQLQIFARDNETNLVRLVCGEDGRWTGEHVMDGVHSDPVPTPGPAGLHVFALGPDGGLLHAWRDRDWRSEDVVGSRRAIESLPLEDPLGAWGDGRELRVFGRAGGELWLWSWTAETDWTAGPVSARAGVHEGHRTEQPPTLVVDRQGRPHVFTTDGRGTVLHFESGPWIEPEPARRRPVEEPVRGSAGPEGGSADAAAQGAEAPPSVANRLGGVETVEGVDRFGDEPPVEHGNGARPFESVELVEPASAMEPVVPGEPVEPLEPVAGVEPMELMDLAASMQLGESNQPSDPARSPGLLHLGDPAEPMFPAEPAEPMPAPETPDPSETPDAPEPPEAVAPEPVEPAEESDSPTPAEEPAEPAKTAKAPAPPKPASPPKPPRPAKPPQPAKPAKPAPAPKPPKPAEPARAPKPPKPPAPPRPPEPVRAVEPTEEYLPLLDEDGDDDLPFLAETPDPVARPTADDAEDDLPFLEELPASGRASADAGDDAAEEEEDGAPSEPAFPWDDAPAATADSEEEADSDVDLSLLDAWPRTVAEEDAPARRKKA